MKPIDEEKRNNADIISFDVSELSVNELHELFCDLPVKSLRRWLSYYIGKEQYEICKVIKEHLDLKTK